MTRIRYVAAPMSISYREALSSKYGDDITLLAAFPFLDQFQQWRGGFGFSEWVLDSGAFSAWTMGKPVQLGDLISKARELLAVDPKLKEVFALDVIGDAAATRRNVEAMWSAGIRAIPTYHVGEPWADLVSLARDYPKIALGGAVGMTSKAKLKWVGQCFARVWPKAMHGFGMTSAEMLRSFPFHTVDSSSWIAAGKYGGWQSLPGARLRVSPKISLRGELDLYIALERQARSQWKKELAQFEGVA